MPRIEVFARTEVGCVRERNEDAFVVRHLDTPAASLVGSARQRELTSAGTLVGVFDGMGGAAAGDVASRIAADAFVGACGNLGAPLGVNDVPGFLLRAIVEANRSIVAFAREARSNRGMGTTATVALIKPETVTIVHVGDSRAYLRRGRSLQCLTSDHSVVGQMIAAGQLTEAQARTHAHRNALLQALGVSETFAPELVSVEVRAGDVLMLCSDGVHGPLADDKLLEILLRYEDPMRACRALTEASCAAGGPDNATAIVARFLGQDLVVPHGREAVAVSRAQHTVR